MSALQKEENAAVAWTRRDLALQGSVALQAAPYHGEAIHEAQHALRMYFQRSQRHAGNVLIASEMDVYFDPPDGPLRKLRPDLLVAYGVAREPEATSYRVSERGKPPDFVLEVSSPSTVKRDIGSKREIYAAAGVPEYWLFDPLGEHLQPRLQGYRLVNGQYVALAATGAEAESPIQSGVLGAVLRTRDALLLVQEPGRQRAIPTIRELEAIWLKQVAVEETNSQAERAAGSQAHQHSQVRREAGSRAVENSQFRREADTQVDENLQAERAAETQADENSQAERAAGSQAHQHSQVRLEAESRSSENLRAQQETEAQTARVESQRDKLKVRLASPRSPRGP